MDYHIQVSERIQVLVSTGVITLGVHITRDGKDVWARVVQPHPRLGIPTHTSYTLEEIEEKLLKVSSLSSTGFLPKESVVTQASPGKKMYIGPKVNAGDSQRRSKDLNDFGFISISEAIGFAERKGLNKVDHSGISNLLPRDSLTPTDLERPLHELFARACTVASNLGTAKIVSRITSKPDVLRVNGAIDLSDWWAKASPTQRAVILTKAKVFPKQGEQVILLKKWLDRLDKLPAPFRDAEAQVGKSEIEHSAEYSSDESPTEAMEGVHITDW